MIYVRKKHNKAYIVIKGTSRMNHWIHNFSIFSKEDGSHSGFSQFSEVCEKEIIRDISDYLLTEQNFAVNDIDHIYLISHSLGAGALVILMYNEMLKKDTVLKKLDNIDVDIVLFGAPKSGNQVFADNFNRILHEYPNLNIFRYNVENDLIADFPPLYYNHICDEITLHERKTLFNILYNHSLNSYIKNIRRQISELRN